MNVEERVMLEGTVNAFYFDWLIIKFIFDIIVWILNGIFDVIVIVLDALIFVDNSEIDANSNDCSNYKNDANYR